MESSELNRLKQKFIHNNRDAKGGKRIVLSRYCKFYKNGERGIAASRFWSNYVKQITDKYQNRQDDKTFLTDVRLFTETFNAKHRDGLEREFTFFDAFKSLSVALKYRWCDEVNYPGYPEPPLCPISCRFLDGIRFRYTKSDLNNSQKSERSVKKIINSLKTQSKKSGLSLAEWELREFDRL